VKTDNEYVPIDLSVVLDGKPDYRRFADVLENDTKISLGDLIRYALNFSEDEAAYVSAASPGTKQIFDEMLEDMVSLLGIEAECLDDQKKRLVSPRRFARRCQNNLAVNDQFRNIAKRLHDLKSKQQTETDYVLTEYLKSTNNEGGMPGLQRYMKEVLHAEFIPGDRWRWTDPEGAPHKISKSRLENRLSELKK
jgi:hypothetical protein